MDDGVLYPRRRRELYILGPLLWLEGDKTRGYRYWRACWIWRRAIGGHNQISTLSHCSL